MRCYFAPMEGITDSFYRRLHHKYFGGPDSYYMPFLSPTVHRQLTHREARELPPAASEGFRAVPQILTKVPQDFLWAAEQCRLLGYDEVNLNIGCPSGTVTAKGKGAGMLADPQGLDRFLEEIFEKTTVPVSVKTRLGVRSPEEFPALVEIFNRYPIRELTLHPRVRKDFYKGQVHMDSFRYLLEHSKNPVCYNGDICSVSQLEAFRREFPRVEAVMIGRGLIGDPGMLSPRGNDPQVLEAFLEELLRVYTAEFGGPRNAMFRLKENWGFLIHKFEGSEKLWKRLRKTTDVAEFAAVTAQILHTLPMKRELDRPW